MRPKATVVNERIQCPHCGSLEVAYAQDSTLTYHRMRISGDNIHVFDDPETLPELINPRMLCIDCRKESEPPEGAWMMLDDPARFRVHQAKSFEVKLPYEDDDED